MRAFLFIICLTSLASAKCGLWYTSKYTLKWHQFPSERLSSQVICNDIGMYQQCNRAQKIHDRYTMKNDLNVLEAKCYKHTVCYMEPPGNGRFWCQNMDAYNLCVTLRDDLANLTNDTNYQITCEKAERLSDNILVLDYYEPGPITTTVKLNMTTTLAEVTVAPANVSMLMYNSYLILIVYLATVFL